MDECRLCGKQKELQNSHVIPNFVIKWMKKSGPTPFLRRAVEPDTRIQNYHEKLLCRDCEQIFSPYEGKFASNIFYPHVRSEKKEFEYGEWLYRFVLSVSWRLMESKLAVWQDSDHSKTDIVEQRLETWRQILLEEKPISEDPSNHHVCFLDELDLSVSDPEGPANFEIYIQRNIDGTSIYDDNEIHVFFKFPKILFFSTIDPIVPGGFTRTEIEADGGKIEQPQELGGKWGDFLYGRIEKMSDVGMSESEREKVENRIKRNPEKFLESDFLDAKVAEMRRQYAEHDLMNYLDVEECPVCYTNHRVVESLPDKPLTATYVEKLDDQLPYAKATFPPEDEVVDSIPTNITDNLIMSTESSTRILQYMMEEGWVVGEEIEHHGEIEPEEVGEQAWKHYNEEFQQWIVNKHGKEE
jgi:hypothetical protein